MDLVIKIKALKNLHVTENGEIVRFIDEEKDFDYPPSYFDKLSGDYEEYEDNQYEKIVTRTMNDKKYTIPIKDRKLISNPIEYDAESDSAEDTDESENETPTPKIDYAYVSVDSVESVTPMIPESVPEIVPETTIDLESQLSIDVDANVKENSPKKQVRKRSIRRKPSLSRFGGMSFDEEESKKPPPARKVSIGRFGGGTKAKLSALKNLKETNVEVQVETRSPSQISLPSARTPRTGIESGSKPDLRPPSAIIEINLPSTDISAETPRAESQFGSIPDLGQPSANAEESMPSADISHEKPNIGIGFGSKPELRPQSGSTEGSLPSEESPLVDSQFANESRPSSVNIKGRVHSADISPENPKGRIAFGSKPDIRPPSATFEASIPSAEISTDTPRAELQFGSHDDLTSPGREGSLPSAKSDIHSESRPDLRLSSVSIEGSLPSAGGASSASVSDIRPPSTKLEIDADLRSEGVSMLEYDEDNEGFEVNLESVPEDSTATIDLESQVSFDVGADENSSTRRVRKRSQVTPRRKVSLGRKSSVSTDDEETSGPRRKVSLGSIGKRKSSTNIKPPIPE